MSEAYQRYLFSDEGSDLEKYWESNKLGVFGQSPIVSISDDETGLVSDWSSLTSSTIESLEARFRELPPVHRGVTALGRKPSALHYLFVDSELAPAISAWQLDSCVARVFSRVAAKRALAPSGRTFQAEKKAPLPQSSYDLSFSPSVELLDIILNGAQKFAAQIDKRNRPPLLVAFLDAESREAVSKMTARGFEDIVTAISFRQADGLYPPSPVASAGEFSLPYLNAFQDVFPIWPTEIDSFQKVMLRDVMLFLRSGGEIRGGWGRLSLVGEDILAVLNTRSVATIEGDWEPAKSVKR